MNGQFYQGIDGYMIAGPSSPSSWPQIAPSHGTDPFPEPPSNMLGDSNPYQQPSYDNGGNNNNNNFVPPAQQNPAPAPAPAPTPAPTSQAPAPAPAPTPAPTPAPKPTKPSSR